MWDVGLSQNSPSRAVPTDFMDGAYHVGYTRTMRSESVLILCTNPKAEADRWKDQTGIRVPIKPITWAMWDVGLSQHKNHTTLLHNYRAWLLCSAVLSG